MSLNPNPPLDLFLALALEEAATASEDAAAPEVSAEATTEETPAAAAAAEEASDDLLDSRKKGIRTKGVKLVGGSTPHSPHFQSGCGLLY